MKEFIFEISYYFAHGMSLFFSDTTKQIFKQKERLIIAVRLYFIYEYNTAVIHKNDGLINVYYSLSRTTP